MCDSMVYTALVTSLLNSRFLSNRKLTMVTIKRTPDFNKDFYESEAIKNGLSICGVDEVGRGCLAGPVVTAAVILKPGKKSRLVKDSKQLNAQELATAYAWIINNSWHAVGITHHRLIDQKNIYQATLVAMRRATMQLFATVPQLPEKILVDAMPLEIPSFAGDIIHFIKGESKSSSIAAASIVAKITRDRIMASLDHVFPGYQHTQHKGYSTALHKAVLVSRGISIIHRLSFTDHMTAAPEENQASLL